MHHRDPDTARAALAANRAFADLAPRQLEELAGLAEIRLFQPGEVVCREDDAGLESFVIADGSAAVHAHGAPLATLGPGDLVGDWAMFGDGHRTATVTAVTLLTVVVVDPRDLDTLLSAVPAAMRVVGPPHPPTGR